MSQSDIVLKKLISSYTTQIKLYNALTLVTQQILGQLALSRGDITGVMNQFTKKQEILADISEERSKIDHEIEFWTKEKENIPYSPLVKELNEQLSTMELSIKNFLGLESRIQVYLSSTMEVK